MQFHTVLGEKLLPTDLRSGVHKNSMLGLSYWLMFYQNSTQVRREGSSASDAPISVLDTLTFPDCGCLSVIKQSMQKSWRLSSQSFPSPLQKFVNNIPLDGKVFETRNGILIGVSQVLQIQKNRCTANTTTIQRVMMISSSLAASSPTKCMGVTTKVQPPSILWLLAIWRL